MELKKKSWKDISINDYDRIASICEDEESTPLEKDVKVIALLCDSTEEEIYELSIDEVSAMRRQTAWLNDFDFDKKKVKKVKVGDDDYDVVVDLKQFSYGQYVDFQTYSKDEKNNKAAILSTILVPKGKKYNDGYDIAETIKAIGENVSIVDYNTICFFFVKTCVRSTNNFLQSLEWMMRLKGLKDKTARKIAANLRKMRHLST